MGKDSLVLSPAAERARDAFELAVKELQVMRGLTFDGISNQVKLASEQHSPAANVPNLASGKDSSLTV